jgi:hypothetical protein
MSNWNLVRSSLTLAVITCAFGGVGPRNANAQVTAPLRAVTDTADSICGIIKTSGEYRSAKVTGAVKIAVTGLIGRLANLGLSLGSDVEKSAYNDLLQPDLTGDLKDMRHCKTHVFDVLQAKLLNNRSGEITPPPEEAPLDDAPGRWTTGSPKQCISTFYVWTIVGKQSTFRDQSEQVDIENIVNVAGNSIMTTTILSIHQPKTPSEQAGSKWQYTFQTPDYVLVKNLSDGRAFELRRCVDPNKSG